VKRIRLVIEYDGTDYHGWQRQKDRPTIQSVLEERLARITSERIRLVSAGRTDAGVHSLGQVAAFSTSSRLTPEEFKRALNSLLPDDIRIIKAEEVPLDFHPRFLAKAKSYLYFIYLGERSPVFVSRYCWPVKAELNIKAMEEAGRYIIGTHDFSGFRASGCGARTTVRSIFELSINKEDALPFMGIKIREGFIKFRVTGNAFLRYMVRNIIGTLVEIGRGKRKADSIVDILKKGDRQLAGITAPARGLFLEEVYY